MCVGFIRCLSIFLTFWQATIFGFPSLLISCLFALVLVFILSSHQLGHLSFNACVHSVSFFCFCFLFGKHFGNLRFFFLLHSLVTLFVHLRTCLSILQLPSEQSLLKLHFIPLGKRFEQIVLSNRVCFDGLSIFYSLYLTQNLFSL